MSVELLDIVTYDDQPTGRTTTKRQAHDEGHLHRIAAVLVFAPSGKLLVQRHKLFDRRLDHSVGGHVTSGETYYDAARREMAEELGIMSELEEIGVVAYSAGHYEKYDPKIRHIYGIYKAAAPEDWAFAPNDEVDDVIEMELENIITMVSHKPEKFLTGFLTTLAAYLAATDSKHKVLAHGKDWGEQ